MSKMEQRHHNLYCLPSFFHLYHHLNVIFTPPPPSTLSALSLLSFTRSIVLLSLLLLYKTAWGIVAAPCSFGYERRWGGRGPPSINRRIITVLRVSALNHSYTLSIYLSILSILSYLSLVLCPSLLFCLPSTAFNTSVSCVTHL